MLAKAFKLHFPAMSQSMTVEAVKRALAVPTAPGAIRKNKKHQNIGRVLTFPVFCAIIKVPGGDAAKTG